MRSSSGAVVTLEQISKISIVQGPSFIKRENLNRYMVLSIEVDGRDIASFVKEANEIIQEKVDMPTGYFIEWAGDLKICKKLRKSL